MYTLSILNGGMRSGSHLEIRSGDDAPSYVRTFDESAAGLTRVDEHAAVVWTRTGKIVLVDLKHRTLVASQAVKSCGKGAIPIQGGKRLLAWGHHHLEILESTSLNSITKYSAIDVTDPTQLRLTNPPWQDVLNDEHNRMLQIVQPPVERPDGKIVAVADFEVTTIDLELGTAVIVRVPPIPFSLQPFAGFTPGFMSVSPDGRYALRYNCCEIPTSSGEQTTSGLLGRAFGRKSKPQQSNAHPDNGVDGKKRHGVGLELWSLNPVSKVRLLTPALWPPLTFSQLAFEIHLSQTTEGDVSKIFEMTDRLRSDTKYASKVNNQYQSHLQKACYHLFVQLLSGKGWNPERLPQLVEKSLNRRLTKDTLTDFRSIETTNTDLQPRKRLRALASILADPIGKEALLDALNGRPRDAQGFPVIEIGDSELHRKVMEAVVGHLRQVQGVGWNRESSGFWVTLFDKTMRHVTLEGTLSARVTFERSLGRWNKHPVDTAYGPAVKVLDDGTIEVRANNDTMLAVPPECAKRALSSQPHMTIAIPESLDRMRALIQRELADELLEPPAPGAALSNNDANIVSALAIFAEKLERDLNPFMDDIHFQSVIQVDGQKYTEPQYCAHIIEHRPPGATVILQAVLAAFLSGFKKGDQPGLPVRMDDADKPALAHVVAALLVIDDGEKSTDLCARWAAWRDASWDGYTFEKIIPAVLEEVGFRGQGIIKFMFCCLAKGEPYGDPSKTLWGKQGLRQAAHEHLVGELESAKLFARAYFETNFRRDIDYGRKIQPRDIDAHRNLLGSTLDTFLEPELHEGDAIFGNATLQHFEEIVASDIPNTSSGS